MAKPYSFLADGVVDTPLPEPYGSALSFLSDLHEQAGMQIELTKHPTIKILLRDVRARIESAGTILSLIQKIDKPSA